MRVVPDFPSSTLVSLPINLIKLPGTEWQQADDGWHVILALGGASAQIWMCSQPDDTAAAYAVIIPLDRGFDQRVHAALQLWRVLSGRPPGAPYRAMKQQLRQLNVLRLRAVDARNTGASYRRIAEALLNFRGGKDDFEHDPRRSKARRLVVDGRAYVRGGYRTLLCDPARMRR